MTSMYPLPFFFFAAALTDALAFLGTGGPSRSSILLALLIEDIAVPGLLLGAVPGAPWMLPLLAWRIMPGGAKPPCCSGGCSFAGNGVLVSDTARCCGGPADGIGGRGCNAGPADAVRGGPVARGGGGAAVLASVCSAPAFLLTQRFSSGS